MTPFLVILFYQNCAPSFESNKNILSLSSIENDGTIENNAPSEEIIGEEGEEAIEAVTYENVKLASNHSLSSRDARPHGVGAFDKNANKTWITWAGPQMRPTIMEYDHNLNIWNKEKVIANYNSQDHHDYPTMAVLPNGRLLTTWCQHNTKLFTAISPSPHSASGNFITVEHNLKATYPLPIVSRSGRTFIFFRQTIGSPADYRPLWYIYSDNSGASWIGPLKAIDSQGQHKLNLDEIYTAKVTSVIKEGVEIFLLSWTLAGGGPTENTHDSYRKDIFYAEFNPGSLTFKNHVGVDLGQTIDTESDFAATLIYDSGPLAPLNSPNNMKQIIDYRMFAIMDLQKTPMIFFKERIEGRLISRYLRWENGSWNVKSLSSQFQDVAMIDGKINLLMQNTDNDSTNLSLWSLDNQTWQTTPLATLNKVYISHAFIENFNQEIPILSTENDFFRVPSDYIGTQFVQVLQASFN